MPFRGFPGSQQPESSLFATRRSRDSPKPGIIARILEYEVDKEVHGDPLDYALDLSTLASAQALLGESESALDNIERAVTLVPESVDIVLGRSMLEPRAWVLAVIGKRSEARSEIERLIDQPSGFIRWQLWLDTNWDFFRDDPQFVEQIRP